MFRDHGNTDNLNEDNKNTIDIVCRDYGKESGRYLSFLPHMEDPWKNARGDTPDGVRSNKEISLDSMALYYQSLDTNPNALDVGD